MISIKSNALARLLRDNGCSNIDVDQLTGYGLSRVNAIETISALEELAADTVCFGDIKTGECFWSESADGIHRFVKYDAACGGNAREIYNHYEFFGDDAPVKRATAKRVSIDGGYHFSTPAEAVDLARPNNMMDFFSDSEESRRKGWDMILSGMDATTRAFVESESRLPGFGLDTNEAFLTRYLQLAPEDLIVG